MEKKNASIASPDELNKHLQQTNPFTWIILGLVTVILLGFFVWSFIFKLQIKLTGTALIESGNVTLEVNRAELNKLKVDQKVLIGEKEGKIISLKEDGQPNISKFELSDGEYKYIIIVEQRPADFLLGK